MSNERSVKRVKTKYGVFRKKDGALMFFVICPICKMWISIPLSAVEATIAKGKFNARTKIKKKVIPHYIARSPKFNKDSGEWIL